MLKVWRNAGVVAGFVLLLRGVPSWGQAPPNNVVSVNGNTAVGSGALVSNSSGTYNTAVGNNALKANSSGSFNTATGLNALSWNATGDANTATGALALLNNTTGWNNTASGYGTLAQNTEGYWNTATGNDALYFNTKGVQNTAIGGRALYRNTVGSNNTAIGLNALVTNTGGHYNTAIGFHALFSNTEAHYNTAIGRNALVSNTTGWGNVAVGTDTLFRNTSGNYNIGIGQGAGRELASGDQNIYLGHFGVSTEALTMRLGQTQTRTFIAGIAGVSVSGSQVLINSSGQVGILASSARYKDDIQPMGTNSQKLQHLRPVTFRYKQDPEGALQYGLIAEEVAKVYPELVTKGADGKIESVQYHELIPMLLNEMQHQQQKLDVQTQQLAELKAQNARLQAALVEQNADVAARLARLEQSEQGTRSMTTVSTR